MDAQIFHLFEIFLRAGHELYLVGGAVRDHRRGKRIEDLRDLDFATSALPAESARVLRAAGLRVFTVGSRFGTVGTILERRGGSPRDPDHDLSGRGLRQRQPKAAGDVRQEPGSRTWRGATFSINAMAMAADGHLIDPYGGEKDLERGVLRTIGDPRVIFREDPLRTLRGGSLHRDAGACGRSPSLPR